MNDMGWLRSICRHGVILKCLVAKTFIQTLAMQCVKQIVLEHKTFLALTCIDFTCLVHLHFHFFDTCARSSFSAAPLYMELAAFSDSENVAEGSASGRWGRIDVSVFQLLRRKTHSKLTVKEMGCTELPNPHKIAREETNFSRHQQTALI